MGLLDLPTKTLPLVSITFSVTSCYAPELRDCTISCSAEADCASGQLCGTDHFCAAPEIAGTCTTLPGDAGPNDRDARSNDATLVTIDAATTAMLTIKIEGKGKAALGSDACDDTAPQHLCAFSRDLGHLISIEATAGTDFSFEKWSLGPCIGQQSQTCAFIFTAPTLVGVKFRKD